MVKDKAIAAGCLFQDAIKKAPAESRQGLGVLSLWGISYHKFLNCRILNYSCHRRHQQDCWR